MWHSAPIYRMAWRDPECILKVLCPSTIDHRFTQLLAKVIIGVGCVCAYSFAILLLGVGTGSTVCI